MIQMKKKKGISKMMSRIGFAAKCSNCGTLNHNKSCKDSSNIGSHDIQTNARNSQPSELSATMNTQTSVQPSEETLSQPSIQTSWKNVPLWRTPCSHLIQRPNVKSKMTMVSNTQATTPRKPTNATSSQPNATI
ncbi:hypothetical protein K1719_028848 [Acacia pycnantha]|nr:hypothetical protein K1719_028848 [Acacia pycnantha]